MNKEKDKVNKIEGRKLTYNRKAVIGGKNFNIGGI